MNLCTTVVRSAVLSLFAFSNIISAGIVINGTRVIYNEKEKEVIVRLENKGIQPSLVQAWIDEGNEEQKINTMDVPFLILPPVSRIEPGQGQSLRITYTGQALPTERESVFWFNIVDIPPQAENNDGNELQMAFRTRMKLFFRPTELDKLSFTDAIAKIDLFISKEAPGDTVKIYVKNRSAFHVTLSSLDIQRGSKIIATVQGSMISPFTTASINLKREYLARDYQVFLNYINDYGAMIKRPLTES
ncbi:fimbria/pilus periplasmic chaperone [Erwinia sp. HDF1-3R]|uniref:fimbria/pilus periplasmic chaperone n=1 Tax=Erwinia sp. HDF1-3R TaxID=3141543 RepID=UPI0031F48A99